MLSVQNLYENQNIEIIEEGALLRKIGAGLAGLTSITGTGGFLTPIVGGVQANRHKIYQGLADKLNGRPMIKNPKIALGILSGFVPLLSVYFFVARQSKMEDLKTQIKDKLNTSEAQQLEDLYTKTYSNTSLSDKEMKLMVDIELKLQKKFTPDELKAISRVLKEK